MNILLRMTSMLILALMFAPSLAADTPYRDEIEVQRVNVGQVLDRVQASASAVEGTARDSATSFDAAVTKGLDKFSAGLNDLAKSLDQLAKDLKASGNTVPTTINGIAAGNDGCIVIPGGTAAGSPLPGGSGSPGSQSAGKALGQAVKDFFSSLGQMASSFWGWVKAVWTEVTGPSKEEAPLTHAVNDIKTDWEQMKMEQSAKKVQQSTSQMFSAFGNFFKNVFN